LGIISALYPFSFLPYLISNDVGDDVAAGDSHLSRLEELRKCEDVTAYRTRNGHYSM